MTSQQIACNKCGGPLAVDVETRMPQPEYYCRSCGKRWYCMPPDEYNERSRALEFNKNAAHKGKALNGGWHR